MKKEIFTQKVLDCEQTLYRISLSMLKNEKDCEDAVQETILTGFRKLDTLKSEEFFTTWLVRILINQCKKQLRHRSRFEPPANEQEGIIDQAYCSAEIKFALESLPEKIRIVMVMFYVEQFSIKEIKAILSIPAGTVKSRLSKGRKLLKIELDV